MSTDTNNTTPASADVADDTSSDGGQPAAISAENAPAAPQQVASDQDDDDDSAGPGNCAPVRAPVAATAWDDEDLEPGDDIGNRIDGPAHHERTMTAAEADAKRKPRRKKKGPPSAAAPAADHDGQAHARSKPPASNRERPAFRIGEEVFGKVVEVRDEAIIIDLLGKAHGIIDRREIPEEELPQVGDHLRGVVHGDGSRGGMVVLTHDAARAEKAKPIVEAAATSNEPVQGLVTGVIKGGIEIDVDGLRGFAPGSHVDLKLGSDLHYLVGTRLAFNVMKFGKNGRELVLSRRDILEQQSAQVRKQSLSKLEPGTVVPAVVRSVVDWGVFVAIPSADDVEGLVHITEASHDRASKLSDQFHPGDQIDVKILRIDDKGKLWLSRKAAEADPWEAVAQQFAVGSRHRGRVARLQPFGAFIELAPAVDGLVRTSDLSIRRINEPSEAVAIGDELEVIVVHVDIPQRKIGLHPAPPVEDTEPAQRLAPQRSVRAAVVSADPAGLLVRILGNTGAAARGFIPAGQTGTPRGTDLRKEFPVGTVIEAKILEADPRRGECKLSIRALKDDNEKSAYNQYRSQVARESKFGTFGDLLAAKRGGNNS